MPSTSTFGIPKAEVTGLYGAIMKLVAKKMLCGEFALENMRSRFNSAAGLQSQGYSDVCELPLAEPVASNS